MARYIDADWIYEKVENRYRVSSGIEHRCERDLLNLICESPTADVVPKSEVEKIFEELDKIIQDSHCEDCLGEWHEEGILFGGIEELKKKYTEGK